MRGRDHALLGQRRGLGIGGRGTCERWFVVDKDLKTNRLIVQQGADSPLLYSVGGLAETASWIAGAPPVADGQMLECMARFRHRQPLSPVRITPICPLSIPTEAAAPSCVARIRTPISSS